MIYTEYAEQDNITFIMEEKNGQTACRGFYKGKPDKEKTDKYYGKLVYCQKKNINSFSVLWNISILHCI